MPGDAFKKVKRGETLKIPAEAYNAFIDAANLVKGGASIEGLQGKDHRSSGIIQVRNDSGADRDRFHILGVNGPVIGPGDNLPEFKNRIVFKGVAPGEVDHCGKWCILLAPVKANVVAPALACGISVVRLNVDPDATSFLYADIREADTDRLHATPVGSAHILWREGGTGEQWAIVRVSNPSGDIPICVTTTTTQPPTTTTAPPTTTTAPPTTTTTQEPTTTTEAPTTTTTSEPTTTTQPPTSTTTQEPTSTTSPPSTTTTQPPGSSTTTTQPPGSSTTTIAPTSTTLPPGSSTTTTLPPGTSTTTTIPPTTQPPTTTSTTIPPPPTSTTPPPCNCPVGYCVVSVVTQVYCDGGDLVVCTTDICLPCDHVCEEQCPSDPGLSSTTVAP